MYKFIVIKKNYFTTGNQIRKRTESVKCDTKKIFFDQVEKSCVTLRYESDKNMQYLDIKLS